ncbi:MAG: ABC transporter ATP-binding protein [Gammaproteobacteria bacterium]|nr:ABC transporter ATP-binding protein [Gammaproteobacteria bacterium]
MIEAQPNDTNGPIVHGLDLCRTFEVGDARVHALDHVDIAMNSGDFVAVMGPSGSGKSTLMNILGCLDRPNSGSYRLLNHQVAELDDHSLSAIRNQHLGFVFQSFHLLPRLTALDNVLLPLRFTKGDIAESRSHALELLARLGLNDRLDHRPNQLSGGQRQRVAIARALLVKPTLLLADEPTGNLDSKTATEILELILSFNREGQTILLVTHERSIATLAHRIVHMRDGRIEDEETNA